MLNAIFDFNGTMFFDEAFQEKAWQQYMTEKLGRRILGSCQIFKFFGTDQRLKRGGKR